MESLYEVNLKKFPGHVYMAIQHPLISIYLEDDDPWQECVNELCKLLQQTPDDMDMDWPSDTENSEYCELLVQWYAVAPVRELIRKHLPDAEVWTLLP